MKCGTLFAIFGRLGDGKTLALTYLCFDHWFKRKEEVYANYHLFKIPYHYVNSINKINIEGNRERTTFFALDEVWRLINSRTPMANRNKIVYDILGRSRKRNITYCLPKGEKIITDKGSKDITEIKTDDFVLTEKGNYRKVVKLMERDYEGDIVDFTVAKSNIHLRLTPEHPILSIKNFGESYPKNLMEFIEKNKSEEKVKFNDFLFKFEGRKPSGTHYNDFRNICERMGIVFEKDIEAKTKKPFYMIFPEKLKNPLVPQWTDAKNLDVGDFIAFPIISETEDIEKIKISDYHKIKIDRGMKKDKWKIEDGFWYYKNGRIPDEIDVSEELMELFGYYVAEGSTFDGRGICFGFGSKEKEIDYSERVHFLIKKIFNLESNIDRYDNHTNVRLNSVILGSLFTGLFGKNCIEIRVPNWLLKLPLNKQKAFFDSYSNGDGHLDKKRGTMTLVTSSENLALDLKFILNRMGIIPNLHKRKNGNSENNVFILHFYIGKNRKGFINDGLLFFRIKNKEKKRFSGKVYNLEVEGINSYCSQTACVHNCFTSQLKNAMDKNVVDVLDFISKPSLSPDEDMMRLDIFMGSKATAGTFMNAPRFITAPFMKLYESFEEVDMELEDNSEIPIIFQPYYNHKHGFCCECKECGTKFFKTYEEAERFAIAWWEKHWMEVFPPELLRDSQEVE
jgi:hypothetical protein